MTTEFKTHRLYLRPFETKDVDWLGPLFADADVTEHLATGRLHGPTAINFAEDFIETSIREFGDFHCGAMAILKRSKNQSTEVPIGYAGLRPLPDRFNVAELIYALTKPHWNFGFASEAAEAVLSWGFNRFPELEDIVAMARKENIGSLRVMSKIGMRDRGINERYYGEPLAIYGVRRAEFVL